MIVRVLKVVVITLSLSSLIYATRTYLCTASRNVLERGQTVSKKYKYDIVVTLVPYHLSNLKCF